MIKVSHLTKSYGSANAITDLNFTIGERKIYGFLGPNGAGKTTTMSIMTGCLAATEGSVTFDGLDVYENSEQFKSKIGYLPEIPPVYTDMTPEEYLDFVGRAKGLRGAELAAQKEKAIADTQLEPVRKRLIGNLSKGYRQRVGIAQATLGNPDVIILDEPTVGLDPAQIIYIRKLIRELGREHTVIISSHILPEIEAVCDHIMILAHGRLVANDTLENLRTFMTGERRIGITAEADGQRLRALLSSIPGVESVSVSESEEFPSSSDAELRCEKNTDPRREIAALLVSEKIPVLRMETEESTLEDVFLRLTGEDDDEMKGGLQLRESFAEETEEKIPEADGAAADASSDLSGATDGDDGGQPKAAPRLPDDYDRNKGNDGGDGYTPLFR